MKRLPAFSIILIFSVLMIIGAAVIPLINIQYTPVNKGSRLNISYSWNNASAKVIEMEVTSKLEGLISTIKGVNGVTSISRKGEGSISIDLKNAEDRDRVKFEISQIIRQTYNKLPEGCSYPYISASSSGKSQSPVLAFTINADLPAGEIENYIKEHILKEISIIDGVNNIYLSGATPNYIEVTYNPYQLKFLGLSGNDVASAIGNTLADSRLIGSVNNTGILLKCDTEYSGLEQIPIKKVEGRIIRVKDVAEISVKTVIPDSYYRINGLNTINITIYPEKSINTIKLNNAIKNKMQELSQFFPDNFSATISYDASTELKKEINKIVKRTILSLAILLLFVLIVSRSFKYMSIITFALAANILIAFILYVLFNLQIHIYSLAGITVSLGIIIDTSIIMISHYGYYHNKKVFIAILAAQLTSIGALIVVFLLPEHIKSNLTDFSAVIIINLAISLLISLFLIPALIDMFGAVEKDKKKKLSGKRYVVRFNNLYAKYIVFFKKHKWILFTLMILGFGIPFNQLPDKLGQETNIYKILEKDTTKKENRFEKIYNATLGSDIFSKKIKPVANSIFGGSINLFLNRTKSFNLNREPSRKELYIYAGLPDGCTVAQLNEVVLNMENFLSKFKEIESFHTNISSHKLALITVSFKKEFESTSFPIHLKQNVIGKAQDFGGANWRVFGIDEQGFDNNIGIFYKNHHINVTGYNYDNLYKYCQNIVNSIKQNPRVKDPEISGYTGLYENTSKSEYYIDYNLEKMAVYNISPKETYDILTNLLYSQIVGYYKPPYSESNSNFPNERMAVAVESSQKNNFDVWNLKNSYLRIGDKDVRFSELGSIEKRNTGNDIYRKNQEYVLSVAFDYIGQYEIANKLIDSEIKRMNTTVLPVGYKAKTERYYWHLEKEQYIYLILIVIAVILFICSILFESLKYPLIIIGLIPVSFIGMFLIFSFTGTSFDQGGFAAMIMLCGIVVNAGIYILNEFKNQKNTKQYKAISNNGQTNYIRYYLRAFNHKIIPIMLTILSTLLGLIPFLIDGPNEVFWFAFALGTIGGLIFSLIALVLFMPVWIGMKKR